MKAYAYGLFYIKSLQTGSIHGGGLQDLIGDLGWKGKGILILLIIVGISVL